LTWASQITDTRYTFAPGAFALVDARDVDALMQIEGFEK